MLPTFHLRAVRFALIIFGLTLFAASAVAGPPTRFTAKVTGEGPDVLLIPGLACPASVWDATVSRLEKTRRVHVLQVAGFAGAPVAGNAEGPVVAPLVEEIAAYIVDQKLEKPAIIGHSLGGFVALALAARHPAQVGRVLVVDASPFFPLVMSAAATVESVRAGADAFRDQMASQSPEAFAASQEMILTQMVKDGTARAALASATGKSDPKVVARAMHELMTTDLRSELAAIQVPLKVLYAFDESLGRPMGAVDGMAQIGYTNAKTARLIRVDGSYHFIMLDQPEKFAAAVDEFLK